MTHWRPTSGVNSARSRAAMLQRVRHYFDAAGVLEVDTPTLSPYAVSDTQIESFEITDCKVSSQTLFLSTSPEFCMKRLLSAGYPDIFSICRVFRDGEAGHRHQPEFTMLEWYRRGFGLSAIVEDTIAVIRAAVPINAFAAEPVHVEYRDSFMDTLGVDPLTASIGRLAHTAKADDGLRQAIGDHRDDWLDLLLATRIAPTFADDRLTVLRHFPATQAALARLCPDEPLTADRFEVFCGAVELANGYVELTDAAEQQRRIETDNAERRRRNRRIRPHDETLLAALGAGLPNCAGVAMGIERLQMVQDDTDDIRNVVTFAFEPSE